MMRIRTLKTIEQPDPRGGFDIYHGGLEFDVDSVLGDYFVAAGLAVDVNAPEPDPEPEPQPTEDITTDDETGDAGEED